MGDNPSARLRVVNEWLTRAQRSPVAPASYVVDGRGGAITRNGTRVDTMDAPGGFGQLRFSDGAFTVVDSPDPRATAPGQAQITAQIDVREGRVVRITDRVVPRPSREQLVSVLRALAAAGVDRGRER